MLSLSLCILTVLLLFAQVDSAGDAVHLHRGIGDIRLGDLATHSGFVHIASWGQQDLSLLQNPGSGDQVRDRCDQSHPHVTEKESPDL